AMRLHSIRLWVVDDNEAAIHTYRRVGFRTDGRAREAFRRDGVWHDMILMSLLEGELTSASRSEQHQPGRHHDPHDDVGDAEGSPTAARCVPRVPENAHHVRGRDE